MAQPDKNLPTCDGATSRTPLAAAVQRQHRAGVLGNRLAIEGRWGRPCLSYFACVRPDPAATAGFGAIQQAIGAEPALLRVPPEALHTSVAWLLPVHQEFSRPKDELWAEHGPGWVTLLTGILARQRPFRLSFTDLVATDSAVIAVAATPNPVNELRRELRRTLRLAYSMSTGELVHCTLLRYGGALDDPAAFLHRVAGLTVHVDVTVTEIAVVREPVFPSLHNSVLHRIALARGAVPAAPDLTESLHRR
jgi:hypothetical protein